MSLKTPIIAAAVMVLTMPAIAADKKIPAPLALEGPAYANPWKRYGDWPKTDWKDFNTLVVTRSPAPPKPGAMRKIDGPIQGDPEKGMKLAFDRKRGGSCVACHVFGPKTPEMPGEVGPDLSEIGNAGRSDEYLFNQIFDARVVNPDTVMPPWGAHGVYTDEEIKDMVAFLKTLKTPATFKNALDNPASRPAPVEDRDNFDPFVNTAMNAVDEAQALWTKAGPTGKACASCHTDPRKYASWAATMPKWEPRMKKVLGIEEFVARHSLATTGIAMPMQSPENSAFAIYLRYLANGQPMAVDTKSKQAKAAIEKGKRLMLRKIGQLNFACVDCHSPDKGGNKWIRGQWLGEPRGQLDHFPTWRTSKNEIWDIRKRFQWCGAAIRANELPPDAPEYGYLEIALAAMNNGLKLSVPGIRH